MFACGGVDADLRYFAVLVHFEFDGVVWEDAVGFWGVVGVPDDFGGGESGELGVDAAAEEVFEAECVEGALCELEVAWVVAFDVPAAAEEDFGEEVADDGDGVVVEVALLLGDGAYGWLGQHAQLLLWAWAFRIPTREQGFESLDDPHHTLLRLCMAPTWHHVAPHGTAFV